MSVNTDAPEVIKSTNMPTPQQSRKPKGRKRKPSHEEMRAMVAQGQSLVAEYLAKGGNVTTMPTGHVAGSKNSPLFGQEI